MAPQLNYSYPKSGLHPLWQGVCLLSFSVVYNGDRGKIPELQVANHPYFSHFDTAFPNDRVPHGRGYLVIRQVLKGDMVSLGIEVDIEQIDTAVDMR